MSDSPAFEPSRRSVFRGGAIGAGALIGALGLGAGTAAAAVPVVAAADDGSGDGSDDTDAAVTPAAAAVGTTDAQVFLKLDGIAGESTHKDFPGWIELYDFGWGARNTGNSATGGGAGAGKSQPTNVVFTAQTSKATPLMLKSTVSGKHISTGQVVMTRGGAKEQTIQFIKLDLTDVGLDFLKVDMLAEGLPTDRGSLTFSRVKFAYYPQSADGGLSDPVIVEWDTRSNKV